MAKKIRKHRKSPMSIFILILIPWIVMGLLAVVLFSVGASDTVVILVALAGSLVATFFIRQFAFRRRARQ